MKKPIPRMERSQDAETTEASVNQTESNQEQQRRSPRNHSASVSARSRAEYWAKRINVKYQSCALLQVQIGLDLMHAKERLDHGEWQRLFHHKLIPLHLFSNFFSLRRKKFRSSSAYEDNSKLKRAAHTGRANPSKYSDGSRSRPPAYPSLSNGC
jgi:hypothetical protein